MGDDRTLTDTSEHNEHGERRRRLAAWRTSERVLWRTSAELRVRDGLAALASGAADVYDPDEPVDMYGDGIVAELERRTAALLGLPAVVYFPTGTMAQQVALRCWAAAPATTRWRCIRRRIPRCTSARRSPWSAACARSIRRTGRGCRRPTRWPSATSPSAR
ncbi:hypothetical protein QFZ82_003688 [Streptomyces sp. V4I23]|nr:hypothetical protein [Streptomyces sp. V4I23]